MQNAPSVTYPVGRSAFHASLLLALTASGMLALVLAWWLFPSSSPGWFVAGGLLWLFWTMLAARSWWISPQGQLQWDGTFRKMPELQAARPGCWRWQPQGCEAVEVERVECLLDTQSSVLLRLNGTGIRRRWLWLEEARDPARWNAMRCALTANARD